MITNLAFQKKVMIYAQNANYFIIDRLGVKPRGFTPAYKRAENRAENRLRDNFRRPISLGQTLPADYESGPPEESYDLSSKYRVFTWILLWPFTSLNIEQNLNSSWISLDIYPFSTSPVDHESGLPEESYDLSSKHQSFY